jgi:cytidine deaminase
LENKKKLIDTARNARKFSQARYSNFQVGAALETEDGEVFTGCNVESTSYGLTICAERVALTKALSEGRTAFKSIAIAGPGNAFCPPCGACRQLLHDYAPDLDVFLEDGENIKTIKLADLLPLAFKESDLKR